jgi:N-glycosylase/DNA lyase
MAKNNNSRKLASYIEKLKDSEIKKIIDDRIKEFKNNGSKLSSQIFKELCFCLLTANFNAERSIKIHNAIGDGFLTLSETKLAEKLKNLGYRFPNSRAKYLSEAKRYKEELKNLVESFNNAQECRKWLVENIKGIGYKEASHFLRNIGFTNLAIIDFHIINLLIKFKLIKKPKTINKRIYLETEKILKKIAEKNELNLAELDLYLWYLETGKILK